MVSDVIPDGGITRMRYIQFVFDDKMVEFRVPWTVDELTRVVDESMADNGFFWVPKDEERGTGAFINISRCTNIMIIERDIVTGPLLPDSHDERDAIGIQPIPDADVFDYLTLYSETYGLPKLDGIFTKVPRRFYESIAMERFGLSRDEASDKVEKWRLFEDGRQYNA